MCCMGSMKLDDAISAVAILMANRDWKGAAEKLKKLQKMFPNDLLLLLRSQIELERSFENEELSCVFKESKIEELNYRVISSCSFLSAMSQSLQQSTLKYKNLLLGRICTETGEYEKALEYFMMAEFDLFPLLDKIWLVECIYFKDSLDLFEQYTSLDFVDREKGIRILWAYIELLESKNDAKSKEKVPMLALRWFHLHDKQVETKMSEALHIKRLYKIYPILFKHQKYEDLVKICKELFNLTVVHYDVYKIMFLCLMEMRNYSEAILAGQEYISMRGEDLSVILSVAKLYAKLFAEYKKALGLVDFVAAKQMNTKQQLELATIKCYILLCQDEYSACTAVSESAINLAGSDSRLFFLNALSLALQFKINEALESVKRGLQLDGHNSEGWHLLGLLKSSLKDLDGALAAADVALSESANSKQDIQYFFHKLSIALTKYKIILLKDGLAASQLFIEKIFENMHKSSSNLPEKSIFNMWIASAECFLRLRNFSDCEAALSEAKSIDRHSPAVLYYYGMLAEAQGNEDEAKKFYQLSLANKEYIPSLLRLAHLSFDSGRWKIAEYHCHQILKKNPFSFEAMLLKARIASKENGPAMAYLQQAFEIEEKTPVRCFSKINKEFFI